MNAFIIAFSMYSKLPMPKAEWTEDNMQYAMCYFPWIGAVIGLVYVMVYSVWRFLPFQGILKSVILCIIPIAITGGIHLDGFIDTIDARHSYQSRERKLEILKDPHIGAFAVIWTIIYFLLMYGLTSEVTLNSIWIVAVGFAYSRSLSGLGVVSIKAARKDGLLVQFASTAKTRRVQMVMYGYIALCIALMLVANRITGACCAAAGLISFVCYKRMARKEFGGITGDLAGYFLQCCELAVLAVAVVADKVILML